MVLMILSVKVLLRPRLGVRAKIVAVVVKVKMSMNWKKNLEIPWLVRRVLLHRPWLQYMYNNVFSGFEELLRGLGDPYLSLYCDNGTMTVFNIASLDVPFKFTAIGDDWADFCRENNFVAGDDICFKFNLLYSTRFAHVFKI